MRITDTRKDGMDEVRLESLMAGAENSVDRDTAFTEIVNIMRDNRYSCVVVVDDKKPVGIITERDLVAELSRHLNGDSVMMEQTAEDVMTANPYVLSSQAGFYEALVLTKANKIRHLPIVDDAGNFSGTLSYAEIAHAYEHIMEVQHAMIDKAVDEKTRDLAATNEKLKALSMEDGLLGIGNRRSMEVDLSYTHNSAVRYSRPYTIVLFDVDEFKKYNDHYGHQAGDSALKSVAAYINEQIRSSDRLYRYGGEELLLLCTETDRDGAEIVTRRIVEGLCKLGIPHEKGKSGVLTTSAGIASLNDVAGTPSDWADVVAYADQALYSAKEKGRNCVALCA